MMDALTLFVYQNGNAIAVTVGVSVVSVMLCWEPIQLFFRGIKMKQKRREEIHRLLGDGFTDFIEERIADGTLTREEATDEAYRHLKRCFGSKDLFPSEESLKERIEVRMKSGTHAKVDLPSGKKPNMFTIGK